jgi:hypothetical protein
VPAREQRIAENERLIRDANQDVALETEGLGLDDFEFEFQCACGRDDCDDTVLLTIREYERSHTKPHRFVISPGHAQPAVERVVERHPCFEVVEKLPEYQAFDPTTG